LADTHREIFHLIVNSRTLPDKRGQQTKPMTHQYNIRKGTVCFSTQEP